MAKRRALLIGVAEYESEAIADLPIVHNDLQRLQTALRASAFEVTVQPVAKTGRSQILQALGAACRGAKGVETLLLYFSGHGLHYSGRDYLIPGDADVGDPKLLEELLVSTDLSRFLDDCDAQFILLVVDACREGVKLDGKAIGLTSWGRGEIRRAANRQFAVIFSCDSGQYSCFSPGKDGFSLFTAAFADVLDPGHVARTLGEVVSATETRLQELCREYGKQLQTVKLACEDNGSGTLRNSVICNTTSSENRQQQFSSNKSEEELKSQSSYKPFLGVDQDRTYDRRTVQSHRIEELDQNLIEFFVEQPEARTQLSSQGMLLTSIQDKLNSLGLARGNNPVVGTFLCFAPARFLIDKTASCSLHITVFSGVDRANSETSPTVIHDNLLNLFEYGKQFFDSPQGLRRLGKVGSLNRDDLEIPSIALREALANLLIHRDYEQNELRDQPSRINIYQDRVEFISPGGLINGVDLEQLNHSPENIEPMRRNNNIATIFRIMQKAELNASGISRMHSELKKAGLSAPTFRVSTIPSVTVVVERPLRLLREDIAFEGDSQANIPFQMQRLPTYFVGRTEEINALKKELLDENKNASGMLAATAICGLGGVGKSVIAAKLAHDLEIQSRFSDGILWVTLGQNPDLLACLGGWIQALRDFDYKPTTLESATTHLRTLMYKKRMLLIVDDAWQSDHVELFRVGGADCHMLVTTREAIIPGAMYYQVDVMTEEQSMALLQKILPSELNENDQLEALGFVRRVGYLPLAISLAVTQISGGIDWTELRQEFDKEMADLDLLDSPDLARTSNEENNRNSSLHACFSMSLRRLSLERQRQFAWLGVLRDDTKITREVAARLWGIRSVAAHKILDIFKSRSLLVMDGKTESGESVYRLHDLMRDMARWMIPKSSFIRSNSSFNDESPTEILVGLSVPWPDIHYSFISRYRACLPDDHKHSWWLLQDDGYIYKNLTWHLEQAGLVDEINELLAAIDDQGKSTWQEACKKLGDSTIYDKDVARAVRLVGEEIPL